MSAPLYNRDILRLAVALAEFPLAALDDDPAAVRADIRSPLCGSRTMIALTLDGQRCVARVGIRADACALGQASAALLARHAPGCSQADLAAAVDAITAFLAGEAALPDWPGFAVLEPARAYPARHASILLPFRASVAAMAGAAGHGREAAA
jgi:NifU-like protein involved in Fe-S cluster formation